MTKINLREVIDDQLDFFIKKFINNGWKQEDLHYITKPTPLQEWDLGIVFYSELLEYTDEEFPGGYLNMLCPWVVGRIEVETTDYNKLSEYAEYLKNVFKEIGISPFHDEDAFRGYFSKDERKGWTEIKFYINMDYPDGYWQNHTLN